MYYVDFNNLIPVHPNPPIYFLIKIKKNEKFAIPNKQLKRLLPLPAKGNPVFSIRRLFKDIIS